MTKPLPEPIGAVLPSRVPRMKMRTTLGSTFLISNFADAGTATLSATVSARPAQNRREIIAPP